MEKVAEEEKREDVEVQEDEREQKVEVAQPTRARLVMRSSPQGSEDLNLGKSVPQPLWEVCLSGGGEKEVMKKSDCLGLAGA